jgi:hypothetical protein
VLARAARSHLSSKLRLLYRFSFRAAAAEAQRSNIEPRFGYLIWRSWDEPLGELKLWRLRAIRPWSVARHFMVNGS